MLITVIAPYSNDDNNVCPQISVFNNNKLNEALIRHQTILDEVYNQSYAHQVDIWQEYTGIETQLHAVQACVKYQVAH
jgi:hypothetical protein